MARYLRTGVVAVKRQWKRVLLVFLPALAISLMVWRIASLYCASTQSPAVFDLRHPPYGWYRFTDRVLGYSVWLPPDWKPVTSPADADYTNPTYYCRRELDCRAVSLGAMRIDPVDLIRDSREPGLKEIGQDLYPTKTYTVPVSGTSVMCARYQVEIRGFPSTWQVRHVCVVPEAGQIGYEYYVALDSDEQYEAGLMHDWELFVEGFYLEQNADTSTEDTQSSSMQPRNA